MGADDADTGADALHPSRRHDSRERRTDRRAQTETAPAPKKEKKDKAPERERERERKPLQHDEPTSDEWAAGGLGRPAGALETKAWGETIFSAPKE